MKVRLYKGPFSGKVYELSEAGRTEILVRDFKKMSRKAQYEARADFYTSGKYGRFGHEWRPPLIEARYRLCTRMPASRPVDIRTYSNPSMHVSDVILMHPDGSLFYEWTGDKREFPS